MTARAYTPEEQITAAVETEHLYQRVSRSVPRIEWPVMAPYVRDILRLKRERNAIVLAHNYMSPPIAACVADYVGDSLQLAMKAASADANVIVQAGVMFMAETSKILNPSKTVLIPDALAGCSLAAGITAENVRALRELFPGVPVVTYVNTSAAVKAESDICCTSSNAVRIVESLGVDRAILLPDRYLAQYVAARTEVDIVYWNAECEVHRLFNRRDIEEVREADPSTVVLAHPECRLDVVAGADFAGSTSAMAEYIRRRPTIERVFMVTECSMSANLAEEFPNTEFVGSCRLCPHMQRITLPKILDSLENARTEVTVDPATAAPARAAIEAMLAVG